MKLHSAFIPQLLSYGSSYERFCLLNSNTRALPYPPPLHTYDLVAGWGCADELTVHAPGMDALARFIDQHKGKWIFGFVSYDMKNEMERLTSGNPDRVNMPLLHFFVPETVLVSHDLQVEAFVCGDGKNGETLLREISHYRQPEAGMPAAFELKKAMSRDAYLEIEKKVKRHIRRGDLYELTLCQEYYADNVYIDPVQTYLRLNTLSPAPMSAYYRLGNRHVISSSPERFLKKTGDRLCSQPIKGTARRMGEKAADELIAKKLFTDAKERAENVMIVDLVRNDLSRIAERGTVAVDELCGVYALSTVYQMISTVSCTLRKGVSFTEILRAAFPMGSMTGAPKIRAMELIEQYETTGRGLFSGALGYISPNGDFDFSVMIRTILYTKSQSVSLMTGSAITAGSNPGAEYEECLLKASALSQALGAAIV